MRNTASQPLESADNVLQLILLMAERGHIRVAEASEHLGVARSTAHRLLTTLCHRELAVQDAHKVYRPGPAFERLGALGPPKQDLRAALHLCLERLHDRTGETCHLMVLEGNGARFIDCVEGEQVLRVGSRTGMLLPAHCTSGGKALLAELSADQLAALYPRDLPGAPGAPGSERAALWRELVAVRRRGYAINVEESERGIAAVGACIREGTGRAVAGLAVALPCARSSRSTLRELAEVLAEEARHATAALPGQEPPGDAG